MLEKLLAGVLRVLTPLGPRYIRPSLMQRLYLLWVFRHFHVLPVQVLTPRQRRIIEALCVEASFVSQQDGEGWDAPVLGTLEGRPPVDLARHSEERGDVVSPFAADLSNAERRS